MRGLNIIAFALLGFVAAGLSQASNAQLAPPNAVMSDNPCPPPAPPSSPSSPAWLRTILEPGAPQPAAAPEGAIDPGRDAYFRQQAEDRARDFPNLCRFKADNAHQLQIGAPQTVLIGDSITENWPAGDPSLFSASVIGRGISGQTSPQIALRFYQDVVELHPRIVHIMAGTNDVAANTGPSSPDDFKNDIRAMVDLARANHIGVILASIPPADRFPWRPDLHPAAQIAALNVWLRAFAAERGIVYVDYYTALASPSGAMRSDLSNDGVHPNTNGYAVMRPLLDAAMRSADASRYPRRPSRHRRPRAPPARPT